jgi:glutathione S-transferase
MNFPALVTVLALLVYVFTIAKVGRMRIRHNVRVPTVTGPTEFERAFRVHQNTQEQIVLFVPALWIFTFLVSAVWGGLIGLVWVAARIFYAYCYMRDPETRLPGFVTAFTCSLILLAGSLVGAIAGIVGLR